LTNNTIQEAQLQLSTDRKNVLFSVGVEVSDPIDHTNQGLYSLNLTNGEITHIGNTSEGCIMGYAPKFEGGVYILEQRKTNVHIFLRQSSDEDRFDDVEYSGTFHSIASSSNPNCLIAYVWSSSEWPMEIYCANDISDLSSAEQITNENDLFTQRNLPQIEIYNWTNPDDDIIIEGILHYPPGKFQSTNLPLLVLIHGGPNSASLNQMDGSYSDWAPLAASNGWLVLEPNYRGSTGYGEEFESELRGKPMSLAGKDILSGVDQLIKAGIADPHKLAVGGCSFGGFLTNWLITQTKRFNAALSCAGSVEFVSDWGIADAPDFYEYWFKALPWEMPHLYQYEAPIYQMDRVRTPTYICTGVKDKRVPAFQSYILKRALDSRGIPAQLQTFPNEGHSFYHPQSQLKKIEGELAWLKKYGRGQN
jgi:dipeptidyl aminopeptidase/acylaminoacyl peptidase